MRSNDVIRLKGNLMYRSPVTSHRDSLTISHKYQQWGLESRACSGSRGELTLRVSRRISDALFYLTYWTSTVRSLHAIYLLCIFVLTRCFLSVIVSVCYHIFAPIVFFDISEKDFFEASGWMNEYTCTSHTTLVAIHKFLVVLWLSF